MSLVGNPGTMVEGVLKRRLQDRFQKDTHIGHLRLGEQFRR